MIQHRTVLKVADNSGARKIVVIHIFGGSKRKFGSVGDVLNCVVKEAVPEAGVKKSEIVKVVLVRTKKEKNPRGTRIFGPIAREVKDRGFAKIASMASEVL